MEGVHAAVGTSPVEPGVVQGSACVQSRSCMLFLANPQIKQNSGRVCTWTIKRGLARALLCQCPYMWVRVTARAV